AGDGVDAHLEGLGVVREVDAPDEVGGGPVEDRRGAAVAAVERVRDLVAAERLADEDADLVADDRAQGEAGEVEHPRIGAGAGAADLDGDAFVAEARAGETAAGAARAAGAAVAGAARAAVARATGPAVAAGGRGGGAR